MKHQYIIPYKPFFLSESFAKASTEIALQKACKIIGRRLGTKLYLSILPIDVIKQDGRKLSGLIATFEGRKQIRFNWKTVDTSSTIVGVDIWYDVKRKLFKPEKEIIFENDQNILQIIDAVVQAVENENAVDSVIKIVESEDRLREDAITIDPKTQGKVSLAIKETIDAWSSDMDITPERLVNTRLSTLWNDYMYWADSYNKNTSLKLLNYSTFRSYLVALMDKNGLKNIFMRSVTTVSGTKERVVITDEVSQKALNREIYKLSLQETFDLIGREIRSLLQGYKNVLMVTGKAGTGKTKVVTDILYKEAKGYSIKYIKGGISKPADLYKVLVENNSTKTIICFDDTEVFLTKAGYKKFEGIVKAMLSDSLRIVSWISDKTGDSKKRPEEIVLKSKIIIISNLDKSQLPEPVYSRVIPLEISADVGQMTDYIEQNLDNVFPGYPQITKEIKQEILDLIRTYIKDVRFLDFRIFQQCIIYRVTNPEDPQWRRYCMNILSKMK
jgi:hypothetical protein